MKLRCCCNITYKVAARWGREEIGGFVILRSCVCGRVNCARNSGFRIGFGGEWLAPRRGFGVIEFDFYASGTERLVCLARKRVTCLDFRKMVGVCLFCDWIVVL